MTEEWPSYHRGRRDHIHALGVIALGYSAFERGLVTIYAHRCAQQHMPYELVHLYYSSLNEKSQLKAIRTIFDTDEKEPAALASVSSLIDYFNWCSDARNTLLHSELVPQFSVVTQISFSSPIITEAALAGGAKDKAGAA
jgi:hypothetical protein